MAKRKSSTLNGGYVRLMAVAALFFLTGCATGPSPGGLWMNGQYQETVDLYENGEWKDRQSSNEDQFYLCYAYLKTKRYDKVDCPIGFNGNSRAKGYLWTERSVVNLDLGRYEQALEDADTAVKVSGGDWFGDAKLISLGATGLAYALMGEREKALEKAEEIENLKTLGGLLLSARFQGHARDDALARIYMALGQYEDVIRVAERSKGAGIGDILMSPFWVANQALTDSEHEEFFSNRRLVIPNTFMLAKAYYETDRIDKARAGFEFILSYPPIDSFGAIYWASLYHMGLIQQREGRTGEAISLMKKAVSAIEKQRRTIAAETSKIGFVNDKQVVYRDLIRLLIANQAAAEAFEYAERAKARALVDLLASKQDFRSPDAGDEQMAPLLFQLDAAESHQASIEHQLLEEGGTTRSADIRGIAVLQQIRRTSEEIYSLVSVSPSGVADIQRLLPEGETLIEYYGDEKGLYAFAVTAREVHAVALEATGLNDLIGRFRSQVQDFRSDGYRESAAILYRKLFAPVAGLLAGEAVTFVPHGPMHYLPFSAIMAGDRFLMEMYDIRILPSASVMKYLKEEKKPRGSLLLLGNPDLGKPEYDLPFAEIEAQNIAADWGQAELLTRLQATETAVKTRGREFSILHFASHGVFNAQKPLESGLLLSRDGENDGFLTVDELYSLYLNADLVTLSACETALGKVAAGDDVVGFTRGFLFAGTDSILSSLWQVDDRATAMLMQEFYRNLNDQDKRAALKRGQMKVKDSYNAHPFFWAAFQLTGAIR